ncbi:MAG: hypothetical protein ACLSWR_04710 [Ruthenibacterium sp.]
MPLREKAARGIHSGRMPRAALCSEASKLFGEKHAVEIAAQCVRPDAHRAKPLGKQPVKVLPAGGGKYLKFLPNIPQRPPVKGKPLRAHGGAQGGAAFLARITLCLAKQRAQAMFQKKAALLEKAAAFHFQAVI